jgi:inward rectifier potassium channel
MWRQAMFGEEQAAGWLEHTAHLGLDLSGSRGDATMVLGASNGRRRKRRDAIMRAGTVELVKRGAPRFDFRDPYHLALEMSWKAFAAAFLCAELGINIVFALLYLASPGCIANARPGVFSDAFFFSIETLATVGYGGMAPATLYGHVISAIEIVCGMVFTAIMTGLLFVRFSKPRPKILFADQAVVTTHDCGPTLMVRIANGRLTLLTNAAVQLGVLLPEVSEEGHPIRRLHDLPLVNANLSLFAMTWTVMHEIDDKSPLASYDAEQLKTGDARLVLTIAARDHALGAAIHDLRIYTASEVLFGMHYAEAITIDEQMRPVADLTRLSLVEKDTANSC